MGNPMLLAFALNARQLALANPGREAERAELADGLVQLGATDALPTVELVGHQLAEQARGQLGQLESADRHAAQARRLASELSLLLPSLQQRLWDSSRHALDGDFETAFHLLDEVEQMPWQWWARDAMLATVRLTLLLRAGRPWDVAALLPAAALVHPRLAVDAEVLMRAEAGDRQGAVRMFESMPTDLPRDWTWLAAACVQAAAAAACGSRKAIDDSYARLEPSAGRLGRLRVDRRRPGEPVPRPVARSGRRPARSVGRRPGDPGASGHVPIGRQASGKNPQGSGKAIPKASSHLLITQAGDTMPPARHPGRPDRLHSHPQALPERAAAPRGRIRRGPALGIDQRGGRGPSGPRH